MDDLELEGLQHGWNGEGWLDGGWIYVLMTASDYDRYKVGLTINNPLLRYKKLRTGDPRLGLEVAYYIPNSLGLTLRSLENKLHKVLGPSINFFDEVPSEWFSGEPRDAYTKLESCFEGWGFDVTDFFQPSEKKIVRFWEADLISFFGPGLPLDDSGEPIF
ncbi:TPA: GIY-YIG nuclease family protein [Aeromonas veronii]